MEHTLVAVFDNRKDAQQAEDALLAAGYPREDLRLSEDEAAGGAGRATGEGGDGGDESIGAGIRNFFSDIFGRDRSEPANMYADAVTLGHYVLTLAAPSEAEAERAADIVARYGPVDIDEQARQWRGGTDAIGSGAYQTSPQSMQGAGQGSIQGTSVHGSQQRAAELAAIPVVQEELKVGKREVRRGGVRIYQRIVDTPVSETIGLREEHLTVQRRAVDKMVDPDDVAAFQENTIELRETAEEAVVEKSARVIEEVIVDKEVTQRQERIDETLRHTEVDIEQIAPDDDASFRGHWTSNFSGEGDNYDEYAPAYRYGTTMADSEPYRGRSWNDVESELRSEWESRYPGSTWDRMKAAIRHGWERMTS